ncbi:MAG: DUF4157 domain-containing protein [Burkholderiaceae bacterium]
MSHHHLQGARADARRATKASIPSPLRSRLGPGQPLSSHQLAQFGSSFGRDFSQVRVHSDAHAGEAASALGAKAFAAGNDIVFAPGRHRPQTGAGTRLLAHELAHVAQQRQGGPTAPAQAETRARGAADRVAQGLAVDPSTLGGAPAGVYCDPDDDRKPKPGNGPEGEPGTSLPPMPNLQLQTLPPIDWLAQRSSFGAHGLRMDLRDGNDLSAAWQRGSTMLDTLGIDDRFKLWFITKQWILDKGLQLQTDDRLRRENPNSWDRMDQQWKDAHPGGWQTPTVPIFDIDWLRSKKKK